MVNKKLEEALMAEVKNEAEKAGKSISWFKYARKTGLGYKLLLNKENQLKKLVEINKKISQRYPDFSAGEIADQLSQLVNN